MGVQLLVVVLPALAAMLLVGMRLVAMEAAVMKMEAEEVERPRWVEPGHRATVTSQIPLPLRKRLPSVLAMKSLNLGPMPMREVCPRIQQGSTFLLLH